MAGLLDLANDPLMGLAAGLLGGGNFGQALGRGLTASQAMQLAEQERKLRESQAQENKAQIAAREEAAQMARAKWEMQQKVFNGIGQNKTDPMSIPASEGGPLMSLGGPLMGNTPYQQSQQGNRGDINTQLDDLERQAVAGVPGAKERFDILKYRNTPQQLQAGSYYQTPGGQREYMGDPTKGLTMGPNGITRMPGSNNIAEMAGELAAAQERGKANWTIDQIPRSDGTIQSMPRSSAITALTPQPGVTGNGYAGGSRDNANADSIRVMEGELRNPNASPQDKAAIQREIARLQQQSGTTPTLGLTQNPEDKNTGDRKGAAGKAIDAAFAPDYVAFSTGGGATAAKQLGQLDTVMNILKQPNANVTGKVVGMMPDAVLKLNNPNAIATRQAVEDVVQQSLRAVLGAQYTAQEGVNVLARAYNMGLSQEENAKRVGRLQTQLQQALAAKQDAANYFEKNGTLQGWTGKLWSANDFRPDVEPKKTPVATGMFGGRKVIKYSDGSTDYGN